MANTDKNIVITPNVGSSADPQIVFSGADASTGAQNITLKVYPYNNGTISLEGSAGPLFSVSNSLTGSLFSVNDISGVPSIEVLDTGEVKLAQFGGGTIIGSLQQTQEAVVTKTGATGTITHDSYQSSIFFHSSISANFTANIINLPTVSNKAYNVVLVLSQGGTGYYPNAVQVNGSSVTLRWAGNVTPVPSTNKIDVVSFTLLYIGTTWYCLGNYGTYA